MESGIGRIPSAKVDARSSVFHFLVALALVSSGCAAPSEPVERKPAVAQKITDLGAVQTGKDVVLNFTLPTETVDRRPLTQPLSVEIYRSIGAPGMNSPAHLALLVTIPSGEVASYTTEGRFRYLDSLKSGDFAGLDDLADASYSIRTRASVKQDSDPSNVASLRIHPPFEPIADLKAEVTPSAIVLTWTPPARTLSGSTPPVTGYQIYRGETAAPGQAAPAQPLARIGESSSPTFEDRQFEFGKTYRYSVRSLVGSGSEAMESDDSNLVTLTPRDTFPPAAPTGLVVALVPGQAGTPAQLELSWAISPETEVAGYNVYRSGQVGVRGERLNPELLLTPAFSDMNVEPGHRYFYTATAVDRFGNESAASQVVAASVPAENH
jgi:hypothetical protein